MGIFTEIDKGKLHDHTFFDLTDAPLSSGSGGKQVRIRSDETGLEYVTISGGISMDDVNSAITTFSGTIDHDTILNTHNLTTDIDHGNLTGLADDDHAQYILTDGTRGFSSTVSGVDPTQSYHLATKQYVDDAITIAVKQHIMIKPENVKLGAPGPTEAVIGNFSVLQFTGVTTTQSIYTSFHVPTNWAADTDVLARAYWAPVNTASGTVVWQMTWDAVASEANEIISNVGTTTFITDDTENIQDELLKSSNMTISGTNLAVEDTIGMTFFRDPTHGLDDYVSAASLVGIEIEFTSNKLGEVI